MKNKRTLNISIKSDGWVQIRNEKFRSGTKTLEIEHYGTLQSAKLQAICTCKKIFKMYGFTTGGFTVSIWEKITEIPWCRETYSRRYLSLIERGNKVCKTDDCHDWRDTSEASRLRYEEKRTPHVEAI